MTDGRLDSHPPHHTHTTPNLHNQPQVEVRNFLGEKRVRRVELLPGVEYIRTADVKDQIELKGNDLTAVSLTAARIQQSTTVKAKDIRCVCVSFVFLINPYRGMLLHTHPRVH